MSDMKSIFEGSTDKESYPCRRKDCKNIIVFGLRDEEFYRQKNWIDDDGKVIKPKLCKFCREERKKKRGPFPGAS